MAKKVVVAFQIPQGVQNNPFGASLSINLPPKQAIIVLNEDDSGNVIGVDSYQEGSSVPTSPIPGSTQVQYLTPAPTTGS